jgi:hypothetical protein
MMSAAQRNPVLVGERYQVVRMDIPQLKADDSGSLFKRTKDSQIRYFA